VEKLDYCGWQAPNLGLATGAAAMAQWHPEPLSQKRREMALTNQGILGAGAPVVENVNPMTQFHFVMGFGGSAILVFGSGDSHDGCEEDGTR